MGKPTKFLYANKRGRELFITFIARQKGDEQLNANEAKAAKRYKQGKQNAMTLKRIRKTKQTETFDWHLRGFSLYSIRPSQKFFFFLSSLFSAKPWLPNIAARFYFLSRKNSKNKKELQYLTLFKKGCASTRFGHLLSSVKAQATGVRLATPFYLFTLTSNIIGINTYKKRYLYAFIMLNYFSIIVVCFFNSS